MKRTARSSKLRILLRLRLRRNRGRLLRRLIIAFLLLIAVLCTAAVVAYRLTGIPDPHPETVTQSTVFVDDKGSYLGRRGPVDRQEVPLSQVPRYVQDAVIAAENRTFRTDDGVSPRAIARAVLASLTGGERQGGSTITQQYVKNALLSPEQSLSRKAREALIAIKLDRTRSKDEILAGYLNTVYFGRGSAGIEAAARNYFGVDTRKLTVSQGAALAAIVNIPSYYEKAGSDPEVTATLRARWEWVLDAMAASGSITAKQRARGRVPRVPVLSAGRDRGAAAVHDRRGGAGGRRPTGHQRGPVGARRLHRAHHLRPGAPGRGHRGGQGHQERQGRHGCTPPSWRSCPGDGAVRLLYGGSDYARQPFNDAVGGAVEARHGAGPLRQVPARRPADRAAEDPAPTPLKLASAYADRGGERDVPWRPHTVTKITRDGRQVYTAHSRHPAARWRRRTRPR
ncbi:transglycosylase domain-containing protein [Streptomyces sp. L7]